MGCVGVDLLSGIYHWGVDNYGDGSTPVFGSQIAGFQVRTDAQCLSTVSGADDHAHARRRLVHTPALPPFELVCKIGSIED